MKADVTARTSIKPISIGNKLGYGAGDFAFNLAYQTTMFYLMYFFTDVFVIGAAAAGSIFLISKLWDAVSDPLMGVICDHTRSRWGNKRPYLLFGTVPLAAAFFLLFASPAVPEHLKVPYGYASFILFCTAITVVNIPYGALTASMTLDINERAGLSGYRMSFALIGTLFAAGATKALVGLFPGEAEGFRTVSLIYALVIILVVLITFFSTREEVSHREETASFREVLKVIFSNRPFLILSSATILFMIAVNMMGIVVNYYFKYNLKSEGMIPLAFIALLVTATVFVPLFVFISKKRSKKTAYIMGMATLGLTLILLYFFGERGVYYTIGIFVLGGIGMSTNFLSPWAMIPDTVEYSEWKTGLRREGTLYGFFFFSFKLGTAIAGFLVGLGLDMSGYIPNTAQGDDALSGIRLLLTVVPLLFLSAGIAVISLYPIDEKFHRTMLKEIASRKEGAQ